MLGPLVDALFVVSIGNATVDLLYLVEDVPRWSEAVAATDIILMPGGKGVTMALAASRLGAPTALIAQVGDDALGGLVRRDLEYEHVELSAFSSVKGAQTSIVAILCRGDGATAFIGWKYPEKLRLTPKYIQDHRELITRADVIIASLEVPIPTVQKAFEFGHSVGAMTVLNPSPIHVGFEVAEAKTLIPHVDVLVPNRSEATSLLSIGDSDDVPATELAARVREEWCGVVCVTDAEYGCAVASSEGVTDIPGFDVDAVDTTAASDAFCATFAVGLAVGVHPLKAAEYANAAGALCVQTRGGAAAIASREAVADLVRSGTRGGVRTARTSEPA